MSKTGKIVIGLGIASGALLAAWLLSGDRRKKTMSVVNKTLRKSGPAPKGKTEEGEVHYV